MACTQFNWLPAEPEIDTSRVVQELYTELLVCGGGTGGLFAAASAAELGVDTLIIEKHPYFAKVKDEFGAVGSRLQREAGVKIDQWELLHDASMYASNEIDQKLWLTWIQDSGEAMDWWEERVTEAGEKLWFQYGFNTHPYLLRGYTKYTTGHRPEWTKTTGAKVLWEFAEKHGAQRMMNTGLVKLIKEKGKVVGAIAKDEKSGNYIRILASGGVIIATGGYANNLEMIEQLQPETRDIICRTVCDGVGMGDGIKACLWAGAAFDNVHTPIVFDRGVLCPNETPRTCKLDGATLEINAQPFLKVNLNGERFCSESAPYDFMLHAARLQPGSCYCIVFDSSYEEDIAQFDMSGCSRLIPFPNGAPTSHSLPEMKGKMERMLQEGRYVQAGTLEELADKLNIPRENFLNTVRRYNELCQIGEDLDFGKMPHQLTMIDTPPYYGCRMCGFLLSTVDGIRIDTDMRALDTEGAPIEGLYPVGNDSGGFFAHTYFNYVTGCAAGRTVTFARRAAKIIAARLGKLPVKSLFPPVAKIN